MRYTTIIDIRQLSGLYRNHNARMIYLHMVLKSGYHDDDRDLLDCSIRQLSAETGLTVSATRHALQQLEKARLITRQGNLWFVKKFIMDQQVTPRAKTERQQGIMKAAAARRQEQEARERELEIQRIQREQMFASGTNSFIQYCEGLKRKAEAGDAEAAATFRRHQAAYERQVEAIRQSHGEEIK